MSPGLLIFDTKTIKKLLWNCLPLGATLFSIFSGFRCHLGRQHDTEDLTKTPKHSSRGSPTAAQELCHTAPCHCSACLHGGWARLCELGKGDSLNPPLFVNH